MNDLRVGWNRYLRNTHTGDFQTPATAYGLDTGVTASQLQGFPIVSVNGFSSIGGGNKSPRNFGPGNDYDFVDHVSYLHGKHAFKFGGEMLYLRTFFDQIPNGRGTFTFTGGSRRLLHQWARSDVQIIRLAPISPAWRLSWPAFLTQIKADSFSKAVPLALTSSGTFRVSSRILGAPPRNSP